MHELGLGVEHDSAQAVRWFREAAGQGEALAQYGLGNMYEWGRGV
jgi:TPR repeat protein